LFEFSLVFKITIINIEQLQNLSSFYTVFRKNTHSHFLSYLYELIVDLNKNCSEYTQRLIDCNYVKIRYSLRSMT